MQEISVDTSHADVIAAAPRMFTPVFTPARFSGRWRQQKNAKIIAPQAQMKFAAELCPLYPRKRTCAVH
jgi:hypothetical protein